MTTVRSPAARARFHSIVWPLAIAETIVWAAMYYAFPALLPTWERDLGWSKTELSIAFTLSLLVSASLVPVAGRLIDRGHARAIFTGGAALGAVLLALLSTVTELWQFFCIWIGLGVAMSSTLYEACFAVLVRSTGERARRAITIVSIVAGLAGTVAFPSAHLLVGAFGWRGTVPGVRGGRLRGRGAAHLGRLPSRRSPCHDARPSSERERGPGTVGRRNPRLLAARDRDLPRRARPRNAHLPRAADPRRPRNRRGSRGHRGVVHRPHAGRWPPDADGVGSACDHPRRIHRLLRDDGDRGRLPPQCRRDAGPRDRLRGAAGRGHRRRERDASGHHGGVARQEELRGRVGADRPHAHERLRARPVSIGARMGVGGLRSGDSPSRSRRQPSRSPRCSGHGERANAARGGNRSVCTRCTDSSTGARGARRMPG